MIWLLYLIPAVIAAWVVVSRYGLLAGGATAVAVLIAQTAILSRLAKREASQFKRLAVPGGARRLFNELRHVIEQYVDVDAGTDGSAASTTDDDDALVVFRTRDRAWSGLRCGGDSFRFRHGAITTLGIFAIDSVREPGTGSCQGLLWFDVAPRNMPAEVNDPYVKRAFFELGPDCRDSLEPMRAWALALEAIATMVGAKFDVVVHSDV
ncbi:hypothetical protein WJ91_27320 [Burkholderia ubonensis]|uniref:hypothetical protein n=1 Tax=Burkholderia ubonensis TaxID=101571 RepID=UPI0007563731|nr:hypothetical protein [Burkholderia ubonensis]KVP52496.1 hypothetical protein WJ91_27320 [Burkholderia ubonensis]KVR11448.1 hypothetical protein WK09_21730 [Burkholderia ubonensis]KWB95121.1 hypothetical protein WL43_33045 [Burkholderia ubonensis]